ncbi:hypothetical protein LY78DRAFT_20105 [Colletotrichum sublineola]|nr:hypothetical protein LY78DRAFT_20105 [Colletotrichum sublineola]
MFPATGQRRLHCQSPAPAARKKAQTESRDSSACTYVCVVSLGKPSHPVCFLFTAASYHNKTSTYPLPATDRPGRHGLLHNGYRPSNNTSTTAHTTTSLSTLLRSFLGLCKAKHIQYLTYRASQPCLRCPPPQVLVRIQYGPVCGLWQRAGTEVPYCLRFYTTVGLCLVCVGGSDALEMA